MQDIPPRIHATLKPLKGGRCHSHVTVLRHAGCCRHWSIARIGTVAVRLRPHWLHLFESSVLLWLWPTTSEHHTITRQYIRANHTLAASATLSATPCSPLANSRSSRVARSRSRSSGSAPSSANAAIPRSVATMAFTPASTCASSRSERWK